MVDAITERSGFLSVQQRPTQSGSGEFSDSAVTASLPLIQFSPTRLYFVPDLNRVFFQFRDTETGEVTREDPPRVAAQAFEITAQSTDEADRATIFNFDDDSQEAAAAAGPARDSETGPVTGAPAATDGAETGSTADPQAATEQPIRSTDA